MAKKIFRREPLSIPIQKNTDKLFNQVEFKGICDAKNDILIDQQTFADALNIYVDDENVLSSRPPLKFSDNDAYIIDQWLFGSIGLRFHRIELGTDFIFLLRCFTHESVNQIELAIPISVIGYDAMPVIKSVQIEDKIFIWLANVNFMAFDTTTYTFENALKYLYFPIHKLVINGIESELETKNYLTDTYRRRHQYSAISSINFEKLIGRKMTISMNSPNTSNKTTHLYDITIEQYQDKMMVYPYSPMGDNYFVDIAQTPRATVVLRYSSATKTIEVSFDSRTYRPVPKIDDIVGNPQLTKDGMWVIAFTRRGLGKCRIVASEIADFFEPERVMAWEIDPYLKKAIDNGIPRYLEELDTGFIPSGHFETIDQFAYVFRGPSVIPNISSSDNILYVYAEWLSGINGETWGYYPLVEYSSNTYSNMLIDDDIKVHFRYAIPTIEHPNLPSVVTILTPSLVKFAENIGWTQLYNTVLSVYFERGIKAETDYKLKNNDYIFQSEDKETGYLNYVHKLTADGLDIDKSDEYIRSGDMIAFTHVPIESSIDDNWVSTREYKPYDCVTYGGEIVQCIKEHVNKLPGANMNTYWKNIRNPADDTPYTISHFTEFTQHYEEIEYNYTFLNWKYGFLFGYDPDNRTGSNGSRRGFRFASRFIIEKVDGSSGIINQGDEITLKSITENVTYLHSTKMADVFGIFPKMISGIGPVRSFSWYEFLYYCFDTAENIKIPVYSTQQILNGKSYIRRLNNSSSFIDITNRQIGRYDDDRFYSRVNQLDINAFAPEIDNKKVIYKTIVGYNLYGNQGYKDYLCILKSIYENNMFSFENREFIDITQPTGMSRWFKLQNETENVLTDKYLRIENSVIELPDNGELYPLIDDKERQIANNDNVIFAIADDEGNIYQSGGNIHRLTDDGVNLSSMAIQSGDVVAFKPNAVTDRDYLEPNRTRLVSGNRYVGDGNRYFIQKLAVNESGNWVILTGPIRRNDFTRLIAYNKIVTLPVNNPGNPYPYPLEIYPESYPSTPGAWSPGDAWPSNWPTHPIVIPTQDGIRIWSPDNNDELPETEPIQIYGLPNLIRRIRPLNIDANGLWYSIDSTLWTSQLDASTILELDEYINAGEVDKLNKRWFPVSMNFRREIPNYNATLNEHYLSFSNLLQVTASRRDEEKLFSEDGDDFLLYLPKINEQKLSKPITNLHTLSENEMGVFTEDEIWYIQQVKIDNTITYTKPTKSKIPVGCKDGSDIITALDGKLIVFTTARGVTALSPQDFIATTEQTLTYLSDNIQSLYQSFYNNTVHSTQLMPAEFIYGFAPKIKITTYKYWILFHRYMDRIILAFDTRTSTWWKWETPAPIKSMMVGSRLNILLEVDFNPVSNLAHHYPPPRKNYLGISFLWADREKTLYQDDVIDGTMSGYSEWIDKDNRRIIQYANPIIKWSITSQKLHLGHINNYKRVKGLNMIMRGDNTQTAKLTTKTFRDFYHPEKSEIMELAINDLRTFSKHMNLMHVINFQYKLEIDVENEEQNQFKLNSLGIKYEVKENI